MHDSLKIIFSVYFIDFRSISHLIHTDVKIKKKYKEEIFLSVFDLYLWPTAIDLFEVQQEIRIFFKVEFLLDLGYIFILDPKFSDCFRDLYFLMIIDLLKTKLDFYILHKNIAFETFKKTLLDRKFNHIFFRCLKQNINHFVKYKNFISLSIISHILNSEN